MSILAAEQTGVVVFGITGDMARRHTKSMMDYGTKIKAGVRPGKGGSIVEGIPVFNSAREAADATGADAAIFFVPARVMNPQSSTQWTQVLSSA